MIEREHAFGDQFARVRSDDCGTQQLAVRLRDELGQALGLAFGMRTVDVGERKRIHAMRDAGFPRLRLGQADARELRIGVRAPRHDRRGPRPFHLEDRLAEHDAGVMLGDVCELMASGDVADDVDARIRGRQSVRENDVSLRDVDTRRVETEILHVGLAARGQQQV